MQSTLTIDLSAIKQNYLTLKKRLKKGADCAAVVKADAYGLGADAVAPALFEAGCRHFYVATEEEGFSLRNVLPDDATIYVLHGDGANVQDFIAAKLTPVINDNPDPWRNTGHGIVLHLDTGMNRLGFKAAPDLSGLKVRLVMSHLACADEPGHPMNAAQLARFTKISPGAYARSLSNSAGILLGEDYHFDQVRPGCALYGINPQTSRPNLMQGVVTWRAKILQTRSVDRGETVGYGASYGVSTSMNLATISAGYADGVLRSFGGHVFIHGEKCPVVGRVSMDTIIADISRVKKQTRAGDFAEIIGASQSVDDVAAAAKTIGYEIFTRLGSRLERTYTGEE